MQCYALYNHVTQEWLPAFGRRRGHTHSAPSKTKPPRLFHNKHHAVTALRWWLEGKTTVVGSFCDDDYDLKTTTVSDRHREDWHVVTVDINIIDDGTTVPPYAKESNNE